MAKRNTHPRAKQCPECPSLEELRDKSQQFMGRYAQNDALFMAMYAEVNGYLGCDDVSLSGSGSITPSGSSFQLNAGESQLIAVAKGQEFSVFVAGVFGGGTVEVSYTLNGSTNVYLSGDTGIFSGPDERIFAQGGDEGWIKVSMVGGTGPVDVAVNIIR